MDKIKLIINTSRCMLFVLKYITMIIEEIQKHQIILLKKNILPDTEPPRWEQKEVVQVV